ncbi:baseplate assembly protein [Sphingomonas sp. PAMC26645]|uniref:baseplate assembly protein n=1 Tax=Sphingomonas sp. PAMC26645 TaxID=2565555 RepID=UPI00109E314C|nr:baseplate J/gp47 family protein [Sphingomonas sp. PAMC26645]QCB41039.1 baseplate assembly protein [Sphingomonas sp. PAMC26645]
MTVTTAIVDLSKLDPPTVVEQLDYETILARKVARMQALFPDFDATVDSDPAMKVLQVAAYDELLLRQDFNERLVGRLVAYATGATLDHIGAAIGVARLAVTPANATTGAAIVYEDDDSFRARVVLGPEGFAAAGPELAYVKRAKDAGTEVLDASAISPAPGEVLVTVLSRSGDGTAPEALVQAVRDIVNDPAVRPVGDLVTVAAATQRRFAIDARMWTFAGPDPALLIATARVRLDTYLIDSRRLGRNVTLSGINAALTVPGVQRVEILAPAADVICDRTQAALCTSASITHGGYDD